MTIEVNKETLDYLRAELSESVRKSAEDTLFRFYRNAFSIIVAVLAAVGITIGWPLFQSMVKAEIDSGVHKPVEQAQALAAEMQTRVSHIEAEADIRLDQIKKQLAQADKKVDDESDLIIKTQAEADAITSEVDNKIARIKAEMDELDATVASVTSRSQFLGDRFAPAGGFNALVRQVGDLSTQVQNVDAALQGLAAGVGKSAIVASTSGLPDAVLGIKAAIAAQALPKPQNTTVFVQFAGGARGQITALTAILKRAGYTVPGEERLGEAGGKHEIRYYYAEDAATAAALKMAAETAMAQLNYPKQPITLVPLPNFPKKPQRNVVELWLEVPQ